MMGLTFDLRSDGILRPVSGENHRSQMSPSRVATQVQTTEGETSKTSLKTETVCVFFLRVWPEGKFKDGILM